MKHTTLKKITLLFGILLILLISSPILAQGGSIQLPQDLIPINERIEKEVRSTLQNHSQKGDLYDLSALTKQEHFQSASSHKKQQLALTYFKNKKEKLIKNILMPYLIKEFIKTTILVVLVVTAFLGGQKLKKVLKRLMRGPNNNDELGNVIGNMGGDFLVDTYVNAILISIGLSLASFLFKVGNNLLTVVGFYFKPNKLYQLNLAPLEEQYMCVKYFLPSDFIKRAEACLIGLRSDAKRYDLIELVETLLSVTNINRKQDGLLVWNEELADQTFSAFKPAIKEELKNIAFSIFLATNKYKLTGHISRVQVLFYGSYGTGKTHASRLIAKFLGLPWFEVRLDTSAEDLFGTPSRKAGIITKAVVNNITKTHGNCAIANYDDGDRAMQGVTEAWKLALFDNIKETYHDEYLNVNVPLPLHNIVTANYPEGIDPGIKNRYTYVVNFNDGFTEQGAYQILENKAYKLMKEYEDFTYGLSKSDFSNKEWDDLLKGAYQAGQKAKDKGLRTSLSYIRKEIEKKIKQKYGAMQILSDKKIAHVA